jgi:hypothetical protein
MKPYQLILIISVALIISSCVPNEAKKGAKDSKSKFKTITINDEYRMDVPEFMSKASSLNESASLQYQNLFKGAYVIVIDEEKEAFIKTYKDLSVYDTTRSALSNYTDVQIQSTTANLDVISQSKVSSFRVNGLNAASIEIDANVEGVSDPISYFLTFVAGRDKLYYIMAWTVQNKKEQHRETYLEMVKTFKILKKKSS